MSKKKHTPGPWGKNRFGDLIGSDGKPVILSNAGVGLGAGHGDNEEEQGANTRLLHAAPDMLAELETLLHVFREYAAHHSDSGHHDKAMKNLIHEKRIFDLIKKASP